MSGPTRLLVPIRIDALAVGSELPPRSMFQWTDLAPDFSRFFGRRGRKEYKFGSDLTDSPFQEQGERFMPPGVHLHFRLPRAFAHGTQKGTGPIGFPAIPNRWLVQRFSLSPDPAHRAWLIESDVEAAQPWSADAPGVTWPEYPDDPARPVVFRSIGRRTELVGAVDDSDRAALLELTAIGPGDPSFSAYYPACRSVLGFHDELEEVVEGTALSYLVTGWYSLPADDPLHRFVAASEGKPVAERLAELESVWLEQRGWSCAGLSPEAALPEHLVCHGLVRELTWQGVDAPYFQPGRTPGEVRRIEVFPRDEASHKTAYRIAAGAAPGEALAAMCADGDVEQDLLTGLQAGLLERGVTVSELQSQLHERLFDGVRGGSVFHLQPEPEDAPARGAGEPPPRGGDARQLPAPLRQRQRDLNEAQERFDRQARRVDDCAWLVHAAWTLWARAARQHTESSDEAQARRGQLDDLTVMLQSEKAALATARAARERTLEEARRELANHPRTLPDGSPKVGPSGAPQPAYRLNESAAPPFFRPRDPVVAVSGPAMAPRNTLRQTGPLACRLSTQLVTAFELKPKGRPVERVDGAWLASSLFAASGKTPDPGGIQADLLRESLLLEPRNAARVAEKVSVRDKDELTEAVRALQRGREPGIHGMIGRIPDSIAAYAWEGNPWLPLFLAWEVSYRPEYPAQRGASGGGEIAENTLVHRWTLARTAGGDGSADLVLRPDAPDAPSADAVVYQGRTILTPGAARSLAEALEALDGSHPLIDRLQHQSVMSQVLDGLHEALLLRQDGPQLPPLSLARWKESRRREIYLDTAILEELHAGVDPTARRATFRFSPRLTGLEVSDAFLPIGAGLLRLERLSVVDAFGQTLKLPVSEINEAAADRLYRAHRTVTARASPSEIALGPRFTGPMRLRFDLLGSAEGPSPVRGWILPNHLEKSLAVYAADGRPLGALQKRLGLRAGTSAGGFYWVEVPGIDKAPGEAAGTAAIADEHLRALCDWVLGLGADEAGFFNSLLDRSQESADQRVPEEDPGISVLVGRPLALVGASLGLEVPGLPAHAPELLPAGAGAGLDERLATRGFEEVRWPVRLGDLRARNDGLVGLFRCSADGSVIRNNPLYPAWGLDEGDAVKGSFATQELELTCRRPLQVTLLMDPQARVHAISGVLPRVSVELPGDAASGAKRAREVFFQTAPVLGETATPHMPRPSDDYGEWSWAYRPDVTGGWRPDPNLVEASDRGAFSGTWPAIAEGWLKLRIAAVKVLSLWVREGTEEVSRGTNLHLAWSLQGAERLKLESVMRKNGGTVTELVEEWPAPPFPRGRSITIEAATTYRLTASAAGEEPSSREITIRLSGA